MTARHAGTGRAARARPSRTRRWLARAILGAVPAAAAVAGTVLPAAAHATAAITIHSDAAGSVWATARWGDGHPIAGPVTAILTATADTGDRVGPAPLRVIGDRAGTLAHAAPLAPGRWWVTVEMASPAVARCEATVTVRPRDAAGAPAPDPVTCAPEEAPSAAPTGDRGTGTGWIVAALAAVLAGAAALAAPRRRRANDQSPPDRATRNPTSSIRRLGWLRRRTEARQLQCSSNQPPPRNTR